MKILVIVQGAYGERIVDNLINRAPAEWEIVSVQLTPRLPHIIDDPAAFLPSDIPECDLLLFLSESDASAQLIPEIARQAHAKGVIAPVENSEWLSQGLKGQIQRELDQAGIGSAFPKNFCTLTRSTCGYRNSAEPYDCPVISQFAEHFGQPEFIVEVDHETGVIKNITVTRCAACGSTYHAVNKVIGRHVDEVIPNAGLLSMQFPCLASMQMERIDKDLYNTLMHLSGQIFNDQLEPHLEPYYSEKRKRCKNKGEEG